MAYWCATRSRSRRWRGITWRPASRAPGRATAPRELSLARTFRPADLPPCCRHIRPRVSDWSARHARSTWLAGLCAVRHSCRSSRAPERSSKSQSRSRPGRAVRHSPQLTRLGRGPQPRGQAASREKEPGRHRAAHGLRAGRATGQPRADTSARSQVKSARSQVSCRERAADVGDRRHRTRAAVLTGCRSASAGNARTCSPGASPGRRP
jgi:hypothetical protein